MSAQLWWDGLQGDLDQLAPASVAWWFRDDDAGWGDEQLWAVTDLFASSGLVLDVAAIPAAVDHRCATRLAELTDDRVIRVLQHGWCHRNHEPVGRRCEFGPSRSRAEQREDVVRGRERLEDLLDGRAEAVFVPPWNRCTAVTISTLAELGFGGLSRDSRAVPRSPGDLGGVPEVGVDVDWVRSWRLGGPVRVGQDLRAAVAAAGGSGSVGVMLHHAEMGDEDRIALRQLLAALDHPSVVPAGLVDLIGGHPGVACPHRPTCSP